MSKGDNEIRPEYIYAEETQIKYWKSSLFNDVYLRQDLPNHPDYKYEWGNDDTEEFQYFLNTLYDLAHEYGTDDRSLRKWSETETINNWIKPVLQALGWSNKCSGAQQNPFLEETSFSYEGRTYRTDILLVDMPKEKKYIRGKKGDDKLIEARENVLMPVEAKYWDRLEQLRQEKKEQKSRSNGKSDDISNVLGPNTQILKYMEILKKDWGILTDGSTWRLLSKEISGEDSERYYEFNLSYLIKVMSTETNEQGRKEAIDSAKFFYFIFRKSSFFPQESGERPLVDEILKYSKKYVNTVEEDLKQRFVKAMNYACNGLNVSLRQSKINLELSSLRNICESALFNVLFTKSLESRNILPMNAPDYKKISLSSIIDKIEKYDPEKDIDVNISKLNRAFSRGNGNSFDFKKDGTEVHDRVVRLTKVIHDGRAKKDDFGFEIKGFTESVFSSEEWNIFKDCKLSNYVWVQILFELGYAESDTRGRKYQQIPYSFFTPRQLGSIYESFLEFQIDEAAEDMVYEKKQWKKANLKSRKYIDTKLPIVQEGELFFTPDNKERKATGSYYTPDYIVQYIVKETIGKLEGLSSKEILDYKVCDPAMGSGHFLVDALRYLNTIYVERLSQESDGDLSISNQEAKRRVLDACIFGIDINPRAVKLAKMSLWLESAHISHKLERLDDQLVCNNTLNDGKHWPHYPSIVNEGFDVIVGNPPYIFTRDKKFTAEEKERYKEKFKWSRFKANSYQFFVEKSFDMLKSRGSLGYIIPNTWLTVDTSDVFRLGVMANSSSMLVVNCFDRIFEDASVDNAILVCQKSAKDTKNVKLTLRKLDSGEYAEVKSENATPSKQVLSFGSEEESSVLSLVGKNSIPISEVCKVRAGMQCYEVGKGTPKQTEEMKVNRVYHHKTKKNSTCRKYLLGRDVCRYYLGWSGDYVEYGKNLSAPRSEKIFSGPRIIIRQIPSKPPLCINAAFTDSEEVHDINSMVVPFSSHDDAYFCLGILNSKIVSEWFVQKFDKFQRKTFPQIKVKEMNQFPIPSPVDPTVRNEIIRLVKLIVNEKKKDIESDISEYDDAIEEIVGALLTGDSGMRNVS